MDAERLARLVDQLAPALLAMARVRCHDAEDIVQQAFVALIKARVEPENHAAWLFGTVRKLALASQRAGVRRARREEKVARRESQASPDASSALDLEQALAKLDPDDRDLVLARVHGGLSFGEAGALVGLSAATAWRRYQAALEQAREKLEGWE
jgi:RNA polymerase sigma factor (sigma-70 family)